MKANGFSIAISAYFFYSFFQRIYEMLPLKSAGQSGLQNLTNSANNYRNSIANEQEVYQV